MVQKALEGLDLSIKEVLRTKNFFALGLMYWLYNKPIERQLEWITAKFKKKNPIYAEANIRAFKAGYHYGETAELFSETYSVDKAPMEPGVYRRIMGNSALVQGLVVAAKKAELPLFLGSYPITPASDILHEMSRYRNQGAVTFQAEDEIAAMGAVVGAAYGGALAICSTSGPGFALKAEAMGLGVILELPMIVVNVQRAGPSTGLPTKTEQADLLQVMYGRNGESPMAVVAAQSPADCFDAAMEAAHIATKYMVPVCLMSDGYIANGAEPWKIPDPDSFPDMKVSFRTDPEGYQVYARDDKTLARAWVKPGTKGMEHRVGGLEKDYLTGDVSYDPVNHERMCQVRADKLLRAADDVPEAELFGEDEGDLLVVGWGGTFGALRQAVTLKQGEGKKVSHMHLRWVNPFPKNLEATLGRFKKIIVCAPSTRVWEVCNDHRNRSAHPQGFPNPQRRALVPGLWRLRHFGHGAAHPPRNRGRQGEHRRHFWHWVFQPIPLLHGNLRHALGARQSAHGGHRAQGHQPRSVGLGDHRRRRLHVHRRQPHHARASPERGFEYPDVQQSDLRAHQGSVLPHLGGGKGGQVHTLWFH
jgi:2-oxoglutarate ferredoxin oxidoreductase subunit alpha